MAKDKERSTSQNSRTIAQTEPQLTAQEILSQGEQASRLLDSPIYNIAHRSVIQNLQDEWMTTDPKERENIVDLIAAFNYHISARNAHELGLILHGLETLDKAERSMDPQIFADALAKKTKMRHLNLNTADTKELVANPEKVTQQLLNLVEPKARIAKEELQ